MAAIKPFIRLARPHQYLKNGFVFLPMFFGHRLQNTEALAATGAGFVVFCLLASAVYAFNDVRDIENDGKHPVKKFRPLPSGQIGRGMAIFFSIVLVAAAMGLSILILPVMFTWLMVGYLGLNLSYSLFLKNISLVDSCCIAIGFVIRIFAGGVCASVPISHWMVIMTFLIALFLAFSKRRDDIVISEGGEQFRKSLEGYSLEFISVTMSITAAVIIVSYILYTVTPEIAQKHHSDFLYLTALWVILGIFRYLQLIYVNGVGGDPTEVLLRDRYLQAVIVLWMATFFLLLYVF